MQSAFEYFQDCHAKNVDLPLPLKKEFFMNDSIAVKEKVSDFQHTYSYFVQPL